MFQTAMSLFQIHPPKSNFRTHAPSQIVAFPKIIWQMTKIPSTIAMFRFLPKPIVDRNKFHISMYKYEVCNEERKERNGIYSVSLHFKITLHTVNGEIDTICRSVSMLSSLLCETSISSCLRIIASPLCLVIS